MPNTELQSREVDQRVKVAIDVGGTFTDVVLLHGSAKFTDKVLTTPQAPEQAVIEGITQILALGKLNWSDIDLLILGTTLATNALIERKGARTALITTEGFRDSLEIGLEDRFAQYDVFLEKPKPLVSRQWRHGVSERTDFSGKVITPLDEGQVIQLAKQLLSEGIESVAVCFLHSYANAVHEQRVLQLLAEHAPDLWVSLSSVVCPEIREYERLSTTCANAYVQPQVAGYLDRLHEAARARGLRTEPFLITSGGGITTLQTGIAQPVRLVESGPAGGAVLARQVAVQFGETRALSFDMGGTTAKICYVDDYKPTISRSFEFGRVHRHLKGSGLPIRIPVIEMVEIGAGGGSIARVNHLGVLQVGPDSAGSSPGPAAYALGGKLPTVTDAHAVIGTIDPTRFAVGKVSFNTALAREAVSEHLVKQSSLDAENAAQAIIDVVTENMANAARVHASELGKAADEYTLIAFGGAAPLHAAALARKLGIVKIIIPNSASVGSALGFLGATVAFQSVRSMHQNLKRINLHAVRELLADLTQKADSVVLGAAPGAQLLRKRLAYMRYAGQGHEIEVELPEGDFDQNAATQLQAGFDARYVELFGRHLPHIETEIVSWSVAVEASDSAVVLPDDLASKNEPVLPHHSREMYNADQAQWETVAIYERHTLQYAQHVLGPALIIEDETTTHVLEGFTAHISLRGSIVMIDTAKRSNKTLLSGEAE